MPETTYLEAIRSALFEEMERDENVFCLGEDVGAYGGAFKVTEGLADRFGQARVIDTPISEAAIIGAAAGAAHMGMRPVAEMQFIDFISCGYDILTNYVATARYRAMLPCPMVVRGPSGGYVRGGPFHSQNPEVAFLHTPGLKIVYPSTAADAKGLLKAAIRDPDPVVFIEHKMTYGSRGMVPEGDYVVPLGTADVKRAGNDLTLIATSRQVLHALAAAERAARASAPGSSTGAPSGAASRRMPALPGAHSTSGDCGERSSVRTSACSRPPEPTTRTLTRLR
jgi:2-oxoisovalerate dehydrogenase E1 component beta subunit